MFARLGMLNNSIQTFITAYYHWKKDRPVEHRDPSFLDFMFLDPLKKSEELFYQVGLSGTECMKVLKTGMANVERLGRFIAMHIYSQVLEDESLLTSKELSDTIRVDNLRFDPEQMRRECSRFSSAKDPKLAKVAPSFVALFSRNEKKPAAQENQAAAVPITAAKFATRH
jgi:hypothetical protein